MVVLKRLTSILLVCFLIMVCFTGCTQNYKDAYIYFELLEKPYTLDPQTASSDSELLIIRNVYEGLLRKNAEGEIVNALAESYTKSGLTYTFKIKDDAYWSNGEKITANDFVFAFRRALEPNTKAPFATRLMAIQGAQQINSGNSDGTSFGVSAHDNQTLIIKLCREDDQFLETLTTSVCMPCNEKFFEESIGKYGLESEYIISNGSYRLTKWNKQDFGIRLYKNKEYNGDFEAQNAAVFVSCIEDETQTSRLTSGESDMAFLLCDELDTAKNAELITDSVQNTCWVMTVSDKYSEQVRRALALAFSTKNYSAIMPTGFTAAASLYPEILKLQEECNSVGLTTYDINLAKSIMSGEISMMEDARFPAATLYYYDIGGIKSIATGIVGHWQINLSTYINIKGSNSLSALENELHEKTLDFALFPITAKSDSFSEYIETFTSETDDKTPAEIQQQLLSDNTLFPVAFQNTNISYISSLENVITEESNGYIDFSYIIKK